MYEARKICNFIIARYGQSSFEVTNFRINKLLYFIHGWSLTSRPNGLVRNHFEAWEFGPVVRPVYDSFKKYGRGRITEQASHLDYASGQNKTISFDDVAAEDAHTIIYVFESYGRFSTGELCNLSHEPGGPWHIVYTAWSKDNRLSPRIPNELIREHFLEKAGGKVRH
jgi:uncharacterized phage-associated protein